MSIPATASAAAASASASSAAASAAIISNSPPSDPPQRRGMSELGRRQLEALSDLPIVWVPFWEWKQCLPGNKYSRALAETVEWREDASGGTPAADVDCLHPFLVHELERVVGRVDRVVGQVAGLAVAADDGNAQVEVTEGAEAAAKRTRLRLQSATDKREGAMPDMHICVEQDAQLDKDQKATTGTEQAGADQQVNTVQEGTNARLSWNQFRGSKKGQGLSMVEMSELYRQYVQTGSCEHRASE